MARTFKTAAFLVSLFISVSAQAQFRDGLSYGDLYDSENIAAMKEHVRMLSSAMMDGRAPGSEGEKLAAEYVMEKFEEYGVDVLSPSSGDLFGVRTEEGDTLTSRNVVA